MFPTLFLIVAILFVKYVDVEVIVGHFNIVLGEVSRSFSLIEW